ncbi:hypothetical protein [Belnapia rosea]|uniref:Uncharacterized protein n=1 Tax=Belnapia rosea TaxID=938405 RepID=A0A1G6LRN5_9PROT|nr:hypothetical protein [Belnapia rosea]SDC45932.1 hypothetical protein SAMN04487779_1001988 [Belnapia rosea]
MTPPELRDLVADALALWEVPEGPPRRVAVIEGGVALEGFGLRVLPAAAEDLPIRWWIERPGQRRPCTSVTGLLRGLRNAVGAGEGEARRLRVAGS